MQLERQIVVGRSQTRKWVCTRSRFKTTQDRRSFINVNWVQPIWRLGGERERDEQARGSFGCLPENPGCTDNLPCLQSYFASHFVINRQHNSTSILPLHFQHETWPRGPVVCFCVSPRRDIEPLALKQWGEECRGVLPARRDHLEPLTNDIKLYSFPFSLVHLSNQIWSERRNFRGREGYRRRRNCSCRFASLSFQATFETEEVEIE